MLVAFPKARSLPTFQSCGPGKFERVINMKATKKLGIDMPLHVQQRADEVIE